MPRIAIHIWRDRVAPVFDIGGRILILADREERHALVSPQPALRAQELAGLGVDILICGAISSPMREAVMARGIGVVGFVAGEVERVIAAWKSGVLDERFAMPGCRGMGFARGRERGTRARAHQESRRTSCHVEMERDRKDSDRAPGAEPGCARIRTRKRRSGNLETVEAGGSGRAEDEDFADG